MSYFTSEEGSLRASELQSLDLWRHDGDGDLDLKRFAWWTFPHEGKVLWTQWKSYSGRNQAAQLPGFIVGLRVWSHSESKDSQIGLFP